MGVRRVVPLLEVGVILRVVLVTGFTENTVEKSGVVFVNVNRSQISSSSKPPLLIA